MTTNHLSSRQSLSFFFSSRRRHTRFKCDWSSDVCSSDLIDPSRSRPRQKKPAQTFPGIPRSAFAMCCTSVILRPGKGKHARFEWLHSNWNRENRESKFENRNWKFETREGELKFQVSIFEFQNRKLWNRNA